MDILVSLISLAFTVWFVLTLNGIHSRLVKLNEIRSQHGKTIELLKEQNRLIQKLQSATYQHGKTVELLREQNKLIKQLKMEVNKPHSSSEA